MNTQSISKCRCGGVVFQGICQKCFKTESEIELETQNQALRYYSHHDPGCPCHGYARSEWKRMSGVCNCGLEKILAVKLS